MVNEASPPPPRRLYGVLLAAFALAMGGFIAGIGFGLVPYDPAKLQAPGWIIAIAGLVFICAGLAVLSATWSKRSNPPPVFGVAILVGLTVICNWVAFGPGERRFTRTTSVNDDVIVASPASERTGRIVFGFSAIVLDGILVALVVGALRKKPA
jgi:hypothetical protein